MSIARPITRDDCDAAFEARLWPKISKGDGCWLWTGARSGAGYGMIWCRARKGPILAHRAVYVITHGALDHRLELIHACDNPQCVNPAHLSPGTHAENLADAARKHRTSHGASHRERVLVGLGGAWTTGPAHAIKVYRGLDRAGWVGERHPRAKLSDRDVEMIRLRSAAGETNRHLAAQFHVNKSTISAINLGQKRRSREAVLSLEPNQ